MKKHIIYSCLLYILLFIIYIFLINLFVTFYVTSENFYDNYRFYAYHLMFMEYMDIAKESIFSQAKHLFYHLQSTNSSYLTVYALANIGKFLGNTRLIYVHCLVNTYYIAAVLSTFILYKKALCERQKNNFILNISLFAIVGFNTFYMFPTLRGLPDIAGIVPFSILIYIYLTKKFYRQYKTINLILLGLLIFFLLITRRTYSPAILTLFISAFMFDFISILVKCRNEAIKETLKKIYILIINFFIPTIIFYLCIKIIMPSFYDYYISGKMLAECNMDSTNSLIQNISSIFLYIGVPYIMLIFYLLYEIFITDYVQKFKDKNKQTYKKDEINEKNDKTVIKCKLLKIILFLTVYLVVFMNIEEILCEYALAVACLVMLLVFCSIELLTERFKNKKYINIIISLCIILYSGLNFYQFFLIKDKPQYLNCIFQKSNENSTPMCTDGYNQLIELYNVLYEQFKKNKNYTYSSLTDDRLFDPESIMYYATINNNIDFKDKIIHAVTPATFGLSYRAYNADFIVISMPWSHKNYETSWAPIYIPYMDFVNQNGLYNYYREFIQIPFKDKNKILYVYKKYKEVPASEMERIKNKYIELFPEYKQMAEQQLKRYFTETELKNQNNST